MFPHFFKSAVTFLVWADPRKQAGMLDILEERHSFFGRLDSITVNTVFLVYWRLALHVYAAAGFKSFLFNGIHLKLYPNKCWTKGT